VGAFPHYGRWSEWNGHFRDTVRQFIKGTDGPWVGNMASVLCGSPHIYVAQPAETDWWAWGASAGGGGPGGRLPVSSAMGGAAASAGRKGWSKPFCNVHT
jgi:isoamylase